MAVINWLYVQSALVVVMVHMRESKKFVENTCEILGGFQNVLHQNKLRHPIFHESFEISF